MTRSMTRPVAVLALVAVIGCNREDGPSAATVVSPDGVPLTLIHLPDEDDVSIQLAWPTDWAYRVEANPVVPLIGADLVLIGGAEGFGPGEASEHFADLNAEGLLQVEPDHVTGILHAEKASLTEAIAVANAHLRAPAFDPGWFDRIRDDLEARSLEEAAGPRERTASAVRAMVFGEQPLGRSEPWSAASLGETDLFKTVTLEDIGAWHSQTITGAPDAVIVAGDLSAEDAGAAVDALLEGLPTAALVPNRPVDPDFAPRRVLIHDPSATATQLTFIAPLPPLDGGGEIEDILLSQMLGQGIDSVLSEAVRTQLRASYSFGGGLGGYAYDLRLLAFSGEIDTDKAADVEAAVRRAYVAFRDGELGGGLEGRKTTLAQTFSELSDSPFRIAQRELKSALDGFPPGRALALVSEVEAVTKAGMAHPCGRGLPLRRQLHHRGRLFDHRCPARGLCCRRTSRSCRLLMDRSRPQTGTLDRPPVRENLRRGETFREYGHLRRRPCWRRSSSDPVLAVAIRIARHAYCRLAVPSRHWHARRAPSRTWVPLMARPPALSTDALAALGSGEARAAGDGAGGSATTGRAARPRAALAGGRRARGGRQADRPAARGAGAPTPVRRLERDARPSPPIWTASSMPFRASSPPSTPRWRWTGCCASSPRMRACSSGPTIRRAMCKISTTAPSRPRGETAQRLPADEAVLLPGRIMAALGESAHGYLVQVTGAVAPHLPGEALATWDAELHAAIAARTAEEARRQREGWRSSMTSQWSEMRQILAQARGDLDLLVALEEAKPPHAQDTLSIAARLLEAGRAAEALDWARRPEGRPGPAARDPLAPPRVALEASILDALGEAAAAQALRSRCFEAHLNADVLREHLKRLPDFEDMEAEERALALAAGHANTDAALVFLMGWPRHDLAADLVVARRDHWSGRDWYTLPQVADDLRHEHPLASTILYRALLDDILARARSKAYGHGARYLAALTELAPLTDPLRPEGLPDHAGYVAGLERDHARKTGFWGRVRQDDRQDIVRRRAPTWFRET